MTPEQKTVLFIILGVVAIVIIFSLLYFFVFKQLKYKKSSAQIDSDYQHCHSLLIGQDSQYLKRLEIISHTNLLYVEIHSSFSRKFKEIRDTSDIEAMRAVNEMKDNLEDKNFKTFKECKARAIEIVASYKKEVSEFSEELQKVIKPEEDCRQLALECKTKLRAIKQDYYSKESQLAMMVSSFKEIFDYIDKLFQDFDNHLESAQYDEANNIIPTLNSILDEMINSMKDLPNLCVLLTKILPEKIHQVEVTYKLMIEEHYPIANLFVNQTVEEMNSLVNEYTERIKNFDIEGIMEETDKMQEKIDSIMNQFNAEKEAKTIFDDKNEAVYNRENDVQKRFIKLRNTIPEVAEIYTINEQHQKIIEELQKDVNKIASLKRLLDTYIHSGTKQSYSLIVKKMNELDELTGEISLKLGEFDDYINSLKIDAEAAYELVFDTYYKVKKAEELVRFMNLKKVNEKYTYQLENLYEMLNQINNLLNVQPISIDEVNELIHKLSEISNKILDNGEIAQDYNMMCLAESAIMYGNKYRSRLSEVDQLLSQAEVFFENGDFVNSNNSAKTAIAKIKHSNVK